MIQFIPPDDSINLATQAVMVAKGLAPGFAVVAEVEEESTGHSGMLIALSLNRAGPEIRECAKHLAQLISAQAEEVIKGAFRETDQSPNN